MFRNITNFVIESKFKSETILFLIAQKLDENLAETIIIYSDRIVLDIEEDFEEYINDDICEGEGLILCILCKGKGVVLEDEDGKQKYNTCQLCNGSGVNDDE